jgi:hypothetical protein
VNATGFANRVFTSDADEKAASKVVPISKKLLGKLWRQARFKSKPLKIK